jgi:uncharacterized repeat protein (TIGR03803 family)
MLTSYRTKGALLIVLACSAVANAQVRIDEFPINHSSSDPAFLNSVIEGRDGDLYGTFEQEKPGSCGEIFRFSRATQTFTVLHSLTGAEGCQPRRLVERADGVFGGTTTNGDNLLIVLDHGGCGYLRSFTAPGSKMNLEEDPSTVFFGNRRNLRNDLGPHLGLLPHSSGLAPADDTRRLLVFDQSASGLAHSGPSGPLVECSHGSFYGTTYRGGAYDSGTIYQASREQGSFPSCIASRLPADLTPMAV